MIRYDNAYLICLSSPFLTRQCLEREEGQGAENEQHVQKEDEVKAGLFRRPVSGSKAPPINCQSRDLCDDGHHDVLDGLLHAGRR
jgi:hypothetical protein